MKRLFFTALVAVAAIGGAFATVGNSSQKLLPDTYTTEPCGGHVVNCNEDPGTPCVVLSPVYPIGANCDVPVLAPSGNYQ